jgi:hypothetical protein
MATVIFRKLSRRGMVDLGLGLMAEDAGGRRESIEKEVVA